MAQRVLPRRPPVSPPTPPAPPARAPRRRALVHLGVLALGAVLAEALFRFWLLEPAGTTLAGGGGEVPFYLWVLRWFPAALAHGRNPLVTDFLNVPDGVNLMWNTSLVLPAALLAPVTLLAGPVASYNLLLAGALALSTLTAFVAVRRFVPSDLAALAGALVYGFGPYMRAQSLGHVNLTAGAVLAPLLLLLAHDVLVVQRRGPVLDGLLLGGVAAAQLLVAEELLATSALTVAVLALVLAAGWWRRVPAKAPYALRALGVAALLGLALAALPLWVQFAGPYRYHGPATTSTWRLVTDPAGVVVPGRLEALHSAASARFAAGLPGNDAERDGYLGAGLVLAAAATAVACRRHPPVRVAATLALVMLVLSMGARLWWAGARTGIPLPWAALGRLPLLDSVITSRLALFTALFAGGLLAFGLDRLWRLRHRGWLAAVVALLALVPLVPVPASVGPVRTPRFFAPGGGAERIPAGSVVLLVPFPDRGQTTPMRWQVAAGLRFKVPGGYFLGAGRDGRAQFGPKVSLTKTTLGRLASGRERPEQVAGRCQAVAAELARWKVDTVVLGPGNRHEDELRTWLTWLLGPPARVDDVWLWSVPAATCEGVQP